MSGDHYDSPEKTLLKNKLSASYSVDDLLFMMQCLRDKKQGCPWDIKQNFDSIAPFTLEETYEVLEAIAKQDHEHIKEELGDLLFQVVFHSQIAEDEGLFTFLDVVGVLVRKMLRRHPHVFPDGTLGSFGQRDEVWSEAQISESWQAIKKIEKQEAAEARVKTLGGVNKPHLEAEMSLLNQANGKLPVLLYADELQCQAAKVGFDWPDIQGVEDKVIEELQEVKQARDPAHIEEEIGDLLFACVNLARHKGVNPELALLKANVKFKQRFQHMEQQAAAVQARQSNSPDVQLDDVAQVLRGMSAEQLELLWEKAKVTA